MTKTAYLTGYTGKPTRSPQQLKRLAESLGAVVVDCRYSPFSKWVKHWNTKDLKNTLGDDYFWLRHLGNKAYREGRIELVSPVLGFCALLVHPAQSFIILCACADGETCHRKQVGEYLAAHGWTVREVTKEEWADAR